MTEREIAAAIAKTRARLKSGEACDLEEHRLRARLRDLERKLRQAKKTEPIP